MNGIEGIIAQYPDQLEVMMDDGDKVKSFVADRILNLFNSSSSPCILAPTVFETSFSKGYYHTFACDNLYYLVTFKGDGIYSVTNGVSSLSDYLVEVCNYFSRGDISVSDIVLTDAVKNFSNRVSYLGEDYGLLLPGQKKMSLIWDSFYLFKPTDKLLPDRPFRLMGFAICDFGEGTYYMLEL